jgi:tRNA-uridine 2-sulfurtransferase
MNALKQSSTKNSIVCAMSGGVDSSVAALLLAKEGHDVIGISMQVWDYRNQGGCSSRKTCCSPDDFTDARKVAARIGIPYYVFDFETTFRSEVIDRFVKTYQSGKTPNPCIDCNSKVKFRSLRDRAKSMRCDAVATGHYARIKKDADGYHLLRGSYLEKDQSYFLYGALQEELGSTLFPVGHLTKDQVREIAREHGIGTADKEESQDICFVSGELSDFLVKIGGKGNRGPIILKDGTTVGEHEGIQNLTVGQRRGLNIGGTEAPLYVLELDVARNAVIVGPKEQLEKTSFQVEQSNWVSPQILSKITEQKFPIELDAIIQVRSRHRGSRAKVIINSIDNFEVSFIEDPATVSPGQAAVVYDLENTELLGGGRIL